MCSGTAPCTILDRHRSESIVRARRAPACQHGGVPVSHHILPRRPPSRPLVACGSSVTATARQWTGPRGSASVKRPGGWRACRATPRPIWRGVRGVGALERGAGARALEHGRPGTSAPLESDNPRSVDFPRGCSGEPPPAGRLRHVPAGAPAAGYFAVFFLRSALSALGPIDGHPLGHRLLLFGRHRTALPRRLGGGRGPRPGWPPPLCAARRSAEPRASPAGRRSRGSCRRRSTP